MDILYPLGLLGLLTLPIIVLLHLLRERQRRVAVPSLLLWQNIPQTPDGVRSRKLPLTLLLLLQLLIALMAGLALSRPQILGISGRGAQHTAIVIDTSASMLAGDGVGTRFDAARDAARAAVGGLSSGDKLTIVTAGPNARVVASGGAGDAAALLAAIDGLAAGGVGTQLDAALTLAEAALDPQLSRRVLLLTDGAIVGATPRELSVPVEVQTIGASAANRAVVALAARPWGGEIRVYSRVSNHDAAPYAGTLTLAGDGRELGAQRVSVGANGETEVTWVVPQGVAALTATLDGRDVQPADDVAYVALARGKALRALLVSDAPDAMRRALAALPDVALMVVATQQYDARAARDLTIFDGYLPPTLPDGALLLIDPPPSGSLLQIGDATRQLAADSSFAVQTGPAEGLALAGAQLGGLRDLTVPPWATVQLAGEDQAGAALPLIVRGTERGRELAVWTFAPDAGNLTNRVAFPLLVTRTIRDLVPTLLPGAIRAGAPIVLRLGDDASAVLVTGPDGATSERRAAPQTTIDDLLTPGLYTIAVRRGVAVTNLGTVGVSAGGGGEDDLAPQPLTLTGTLTDAGAVPRRAAADLWPYLALGALALLLFEWAYVLRPRRLARPAPQGP